MTNKCQCQYIEGGRYVGGWSQMTLCLIILSDFGLKFGEGEEGFVHVSVLIVL